MVDNPFSGLTDSIGPTIKHLTERSLQDQEKLENRFVRRFNEQCYLVSFWKKFADFNRKQTYENVTPIDGDPGTMLNKLIVARDLQPMFELTPAQVSALVPKIRLFKVVYEDDGVTVKADPEFKFKDYIDQDELGQIVASKSGRGSGVGIKSFELEFMGNQPAEIDIIDRATLVLHFQNIEELTRKSDDPTVASPLDLIMLPKAPNSKIRTKNLTQSAAQFYEPNLFEIKALVGWSLPPRTHELFDKDTRAAIEKSNLTVVMNLVNHTLNFAQNGTIELTLEYKGRIESVLESRDLDIFGLSPQEKEQREKDRLALLGLKRSQEKISGRRTSIFDIGKTTLGQGAFSQLTSIAENKTEQTIAAAGRRVDEAVTDIEKKQKSRRGIRHRRLLQQMDQAGRLFSLELTKTQIDTFVRTMDDTIQLELTQEQWDKLTESEKTQFAKKFWARMLLSEPEVGISSFENFSETIEKGLVKETAEKILHSLFPEDQNATETKLPTQGDIYTFSYFYLGDLIDAALSVVPSSVTKKRFRVLLGPITYVDPKLGESFTVNLSDLPISLDLFTAWWVKNVSKPDVDSMPFKVFVQKLVTELVLSALGSDCFNAGSSIKSPFVSLGLAPITIPGKKEGSKIRGPFGPERINIADVSIPQNVNPRATELLDYLFIYVTGVTSDELRGNMKKDGQSGIYHFSIGQDRGLIKSIEFNKQDMEFLKESFITQESVVDRIRLPYNADVRMIGNGLFRPGALVYVNPSLPGLGNPASRHSVVAKLGLGGYYTILGVVLDLAPGRFETRLKLQFMSWPDAQNKKTNNNSAVGVGKALKKISDIF